jgi:hypothetical protein
MDNNALMAALGIDAVAAVKGYRAAVVSEATRRGLRFTGGALAGPAWPRGLDPLNIRLTVDDADRADLAGRMLGWSAATGWWRRCPRTRDRVRFYAEPKAHPLHLVPSPPEVVDWAIAGLGNVEPPVGVELEDDPAALHRLLGFVDSHRRLHAIRAIRTPPRRPATPVGPPRPVTRGDRRAALRP